LKSHFVISSSPSCTVAYKTSFVCITRLAFLAASLGARQVIGMCASGTRYGIMTAHFYWIGAAPARLFRRHLHDAVLLLPQSQKF